MLCFRPSFLTVVHPAVAVAREKKTLLLTAPISASSQQAILLIIRHLFRIQLGHINAKLHHPLLTARDCLFSEEVDYPPVYGGFRRSSVTRARIDYLLVNPR